MSSGNSTSFYINLAGNLSQQAARFGRDVSQFATQSSTKLTALSARLKATTSHFKTLGQGIGSVSNKINSIGNITIPVLGVGVAAGAATVGKSMLRTAADFEMAGIRMKQTFGKRGDEAMTWLKQFAVDTPMAFGDVQDAAMKLMTAGIDPMNGSLQALVDYNAKIGGTKEQLNDFINSFQKMSATGKMTWEDVLPLLQRNVPVLKMLSEATGGKYSDKQILQMIRNGEMQGKAIDALWKQMGKRAKGAAKEQMKTWDGLVSNLEDTWTAMQARFMEHGAFDALKKEMSGFVDWLNEKIDDGTLDEFAKTVSDTLITALKDLKEMAKDVKPILESIGSVMSWVSEKAGGYGNIAKFAAALYGANKLARITLSAGQGIYGFGKGVTGTGKAVFGVGKALFGRNKASSLPSPAASVAGALGQASGVQSVYVVNMPADFGGFGGGRRGKKARVKNNKRFRSNKSANRQKNNRPKAKPTTSAKPISAAKETAKRVKPVTTQAVQNTKPALTKPTITPNVAPKTAPGIGANLANGVKQAGQSLKNTAASVTKSTASLAQSATSAVSKTVAKAVPMLNTGLALAEGASVLLDEDATTKEKSESIGSIAGATAGAMIGQALIPVPILGAAIGGFLGEKIGGWFGDKVGDMLEDKPEPQPAPPTQISAAIANVGQSVGGFVASDVGEKLAGVNPIESKLNGQIELKVKPTEGLLASVGKAEINTNQRQSNLGLKVSMGYSGVGLYSGA